MKLIPDQIDRPGVHLQRVPIYGNYGDPFNGAAVVILGHVGLNTMLVVFSNGDGWEHVSVSLRTRTPTWDEMCIIRDLFFEPEEWVVQFHPPHKEYVNNHPYCLHLWRSLDAPQPTPPSIMTGYPGMTPEQARKLAIEGKL